VDQSAEAPLVLAAFDRRIAGKRIVAVANGRGLLLVYDVSDPSAPKKAATYKMPGRALRLAADGNRLYIADGPAGLQIVGLEDPASPVILATWTAVSPVRDVAASDGIVMVVAGGPGQGVIVLRSDSVP
jgi:hypothetical protein